MFRGLKFGAGQGVLTWTLKGTKEECAEGEKTYKFLRPSSNQEIWKTVKIKKKLTFGVNK